jgi:periplasmic protein TonB
MWYLDPSAARLQHDRELRTLYACLGVSVVLHGLAMLSFPGSRPAESPDEARPLTALLASRPEPVKAAPVPAQRLPRARREAELPAPLSKPVDPEPVLAKAAEAAAAPVPSPQPAALPSVASSAPESVSTQLPARPSAEALDASLLEAYRLALIDAARRYKRYPVQAMERGWEGRVEIRVVVGENGTIKSALVKRSSRYPILDDQALDMVRKAFNALAQVRPAPRGHEFTVDVPVVFELQTG